MQSNYKALGEYIQPVDQRNKDLLDLPLVGLSISKRFIPSIANTVGTNMATYKIIERNQFAYSGVTSRNGDKITIALFDDYDKALISQAYTPFEVKKTTKLDPEYLMMWFRRPEFDRYARFKSHGSAREIFDWEEMCNVMIPVPSIEKQREIVAEYNTIQNRINLNNQLIQKLEETAQAIYREWFVKDRDDAWEIVQIKNFGEVITGKTPSSRNPEDFGHEMSFITPGDFKNNSKYLIQSERKLSADGYRKLNNKVLTEGSIIVTCIGSDMGKISIAYEKCITNQQMNSIKVNKQFYTDYLYHYLHSVSEEKIKGVAMGSSTMPMLNKSDFEKIEVIKPSDDMLMKFDKAMKPINKLITNFLIENQKLEELKNLLLSQMAILK